MYVNKIKMYNYRNIENLNLDLNKGINIIIGDNGVGKSNILEAIYMSSITKSYRTNYDSELVQYNKNYMNISIKIKNELNNNIIISYSNNNKKILLNKTKIKRLVDYIGVFPMIISSPEDVEIIKNSPNNRRNLINISISQFDNTYLCFLNKYNKLLKIRNDYIKKLAVSSFNDKKYLDIITEKMIEYYIYIYRKRVEYINFINEYLNVVFNNITNKGKLYIEYIPSIYLEQSSNDENLKKQIINHYNKNYNKELNYGMTLNGIHRDDINFILNSQNMKNYSSEGEKKLALISYKLSEMLFFKEILKKDVILLYDDLFSEIDVKNRNNLIKYISNNLQVIITSNDIRGINKKIRDKSNIIKIIKTKTGEIIWKKK